MGEDGLSGQGRPMTETILALMFAFALPLPLLFLEAIAPVPFLIEEMVMAILILFIVRSSIEERWKLPAVVLAGFLFSISETMFYLINYLSIGQSYLVFIRFLFTGSMHVLTTIVIYLFARKRGYSVLIGLILAILIHFVFNTLI